AEGLVRVSDAATFSAWLEQSEASIPGFGDMRMAVDSPSAQEDMGIPGAEHVLGTNVQTLGIDEPDMLKTDGEHIFYSSTSWRVFPMPIIRDIIDQPTDSVDDERLLPPELYQPT